MPGHGRARALTTSSTLIFFREKFQGDFVENSAAAVLTLRAAENEPAGASSVTVCVSITDNICVVAIGWGRTIFRPSTLAW